MRDENRTRNFGGARAASIHRSLRNPLVLFGAILLGGGGPLMGAYVATEDPWRATVLMAALIVFIFVIVLCFCYLAIFKPRNLYSPSEIPESAYGQSLYRDIVDPEAWKAVVIKGACIAGHEEIADVLDSLAGAPANIEAFRRQVEVLLSDVVERALRLQAEHESGIDSKIGELKEEAERRIAAISKSLRSQDEVIETIRKRLEEVLSSAIQTAREVEAEAVAVRRERISWRQLRAALKKKGCRIERRGGDAIVVGPLCDGKRQIVTIGHRYCSSPSSLLLPSHMCAMLRAFGELPVAGSGHDNSGA